MGSGQNWHGRINCKTTARTEYMLGDAGSIVSLVGVAVSLVGLGFAILQLRKLRGETRAAREAAEGTRSAIRKELASRELTRLGERIQALKDLHRSGNRERCLDTYPEIRELLLEIRRRHPGLSVQQRADVLRAITQISTIESHVETSGPEIPSDSAADFNAILTDVQSTLLPQLEDQLQELA